MHTPGRPCLLVVDIDGTAIADSARRVPRELRDAFAACTESGDRLVLATSRAPLRVIELDLDPAWCPEVVVCGGGAVLEVATGRLTGAVSIDPVTLAVVGEVLGQLGERLGVAWARSTGPVPEVAGDVVRVEDLPRGDAWGLKLSCRLVSHGADDVMAALAPLVGDRCTLGSSSAHHLEIVGRGVSKRTAVARIAARLGVPHESIIGIGNGPNDADYLAWASWAVAVEPLDPVLAGLADEVIASPEEGGLVEWLSRRSAW